uniref:Uncharacterized protein n=1 Tax=Rhizophagus irregularis (strain DAOM 181602 / DAOM 197198 / MUCL 43194) TaxID=747089 RepID=U9TZJ3_RHIID
MEEDMGTQQNDSVHPLSEDEQFEDALTSPNYRQFQRCLKVKKGLKIIID